MSVLFVKPTKKLHCVRVWFIKRQFIVDAFLTSA